MLSHSIDMITSSSTSEFAQYLKLLNNCLILFHVPPLPVLRRGELVQSRGFHGRALIRVRSGGYEICQRGVLKNSGRSGCRTDGSRAALRACRIIADWQGK